MMLWKMRLTCSVGPDPSVRLHHDLLIVTDCRQTILSYFWVITLGDNVLELDVSWA